MLEFQQLYFLEPFIGNEFIGWAALEHGNNVGSYSKREKDILGRVEDFGCIKFEFFKLKTELRSDFQSCWSAVGVVLREERKAQSHVPS